MGSSENEGIHEDHIRLDREKRHWQNYRIAGFLGVHKQHRHSCRFSSDDEWAEMAPKALDFRFGNFLGFGLNDDFRHALASPTMVGKFSCGIAQYQTAGERAYCLLPLRSCSYLIYL
jgi:hypothetical protein